MGTPEEASIPETEPKDPDQVWAEDYTAKIRAMGFFVYCGALEDTAEDGRSRCYALTLNQTEIVPVLDDLGFQGRLASETNWDGQAFGEERSITLPLDTVLGHPKTQRGASRQEALLAAVRAGYRPSVPLPRSSRPGWLRQPEIKNPEPTD
jgi:hypothetical protein